MAFYEVTVQTGAVEEATTFNDVFIKLVGTLGESNRTMLKNEKLSSAFTQGQVSTFTVSCTNSLGDLVCIVLDKQAHDMFPVDFWFCDKVEVKSKEEQTYMFPIYRWITDSKEHIFIEGTGSLQTYPLKMTESGMPYKATVQSFNLKKLWQTPEEIRKEELEQRKKDYCWWEFKEGLPYCIKADGPLSLPCEVWFSIRNIIKTGEFFYSATKGLKWLGLEELADCKDKWNHIDEIKRIFLPNANETSVYVMNNWEDDAFFAYQYLNGVNPMIIQRCTALPDNFPVTDDMVSLQGRVLADEMKNGNIFLCDYKNLDGLKPNTINGKEQFLMAPLVLFHKTPDDKLMPVAIQLKQTPGKDNTIFVPNDPDWLLAKTFVRSSEFNEHELNSHLLRTHLLAEVFAVSLLRNIPSMHPLYKLLMPHTRYTLQINILARKYLISDDGIFTEYTASGGEAMITILRRSMTSLTYRSLCIQDNIADRGLESVPNFYYRDDGFELWEIIYRFVQGILKYYYKNDDQVQNDMELQDWIGDIFKYGFLSQKSSGIPENLNTVDEMVKFVTMVIFTCSAQHSAVNSGQFEYGSWMPNTPTSLQVPLPTEEGTLLQKLPDVNTTVHGMVIMWLLSKQSCVSVYLGQYPEAYFSEKTPRKLIKDFQGELLELSKHIKHRNLNRPIPYTYMDPAVIENSVAL